MAEKIETKGLLIEIPTSHQRDSWAARGIKLVKPSCQVPITYDMGGRITVDFTTGPHLQAVATNPSYEFKWWKECTHGPEFDTDGEPILPHRRPYFEGYEVVRSIPVIGERGAITGRKEERTWKVTPRFFEANLSKASMSKEGIKFNLARGAKSVVEFGYAPFCEMRGCWIQDLWQYKNGKFCSDIHAQLVFAAENEIIVPLPGDSRIDPEGRGRAKRNEILKGMNI